MHRASRTVLVAVLALGLALATLPAAPAAEAQACPPPGGLDPVWAEPASPDLDFHVLGRGWGHGVGMSQHGAEGAGRQGCNVEQILTTYYPGTALASRDDRAIRVAITFLGGPRTNARVRALEGDLSWMFGDVEAAAQPEHDNGTEHDRRLAVDGSGHLLIQRLEGQQWEQVWRAGSPGGHLTASLSNGSRHVRLLDKGVTYNRGTMRVHAVPHEGSWRLLPVVHLPSMEQYLYGLAEVPASWTEAALQAQAITGRSYAHRQFRPGEPYDLVDSASAQVYSAFEKEDSFQGDRWVAAVDATRQRVLTYDGQIAETFYSSSHGGHSERLGFSGFFDAHQQRPYLQPVDDSRWEEAAPSAVTRWSVSYSRDHMTAAFSHLGLGTVLSIQTPAPRGAGHRIGDPARTNADGQRYGGVVVAGSERTARMSGKAFIDALQASESNPRLNRRSELFQVVSGPQCRPSTDQSGNEVVRRSAGPHRVGTAAAVSAQHWDDGADDVVLATSITFPDALSAGVLAARLGAPILLTRFSLLDPETEAELRRLDPERVHLMGGSAALSGRVEAEVQALGFETVRVQGPSRFDTAAAAARAAGASETGEVALANGNDWPDAVSAGALSGGPDRIPTLLSLRDDVPSVTLDALDDLGAEKVLLIGGTAVLSGGVVQRLEASGFEVERLSGPNRFATSVEVAGDAAGRADGDRPVVLATGSDFPDALSAGGLVAQLEGGLVLTTACDMGSAVDEARSPIVIEHVRDGPYDRGVIVGGTAAVSDLVREQATAAIIGEQ